ncbi:MAG: hypothetical protein DLM57_16325 [Pseudonocardiales bacterium]|nr:MAG: hypothetical protein DLM57_16325 [Pseudonocardiales bacterium]
MHSPLSGIPIARRRQLAATLGLFAVLFVAVGVVAATGTTTPGIVRVFSAIALGVAVLLGTVAWGVTHSVKLDRGEVGLDAAIADAVRSHSGSGRACGCGHDHDPDEMHVSAETCAHDGTGTDCTHSCDTCMLAALRPSPTLSRAERVAEQPAHGSVGPPGAKL